MTTKMSDPSSIAPLIITKVLHLVELIEKEEKDIIAGLKWSLGATAIFAIFGITKF